MGEWGGSFSYLTYRLNELVIFYEHIMYGLLYIYYVLKFNLCWTY